MKNLRMTGLIAVSFGLFSLSAQAKEPGPEADFTVAPGAPKPIPTFVEKKTAEAPVPEGPEPRVIVKSRHAWRKVFFTDEKGQGNQLWCRHSQCNDKIKTGQARLYDLVDVGFTDPEERTARRTPYWLTLENGHVTTGGEAEISGSERKETQSFLTTNIDIPAPAVALRLENWQEVVFTNEKGEEARLWCVKHECSEKANGIARLYTLDVWAKKPKDYRRPTPTNYVINPGLSSVSGRLAGGKFMNAQATRAETKKLLVDNAPLLKKADMDAEEDTVQAPAKADSAPVASTAKEQAEQAAEGENVFDHAADKSKGVVYAAAAYEEALPDTRPIAPEQKSPDGDAPPALGAETPQPKNAGILAANGGKLLQALGGAMLWMGGLAAVGAAMGAGNGVSLGLGFGASIGAAAGPAGAMLGAAVGAAAGLLFGTAISYALLAFRKG